MQIINKSKLLYDYTWMPIPTDDARISGELDGSLLKRTEGLQVLYFINKACAIFEYTSLEAALKMERLIRNAVPNEVVSQEGIKDWLHQNWTKF